MRTPIWIEERDALALHERLIALHGGASGIRDESLLKSVLARYGDAPTVVDLAAAYTSGIVRNHPFVDGDKRTGFVAGILFLELNGFLFSASEEDAAQAVLNLAAGKLGEEGYANFLRGNSKSA